MIRGIPENVQSISQDLDMLELVHSWGEESLSEVTKASKLNPSSEATQLVRDYERHVDELLSMIQEHPERRDGEEGW